MITPPSTILVVAITNLNEIHVVEAVDAPVLQMSLHDLLQHLASYYTSAYRGLECEGVFLFGIKNVRDVTDS